MNETLDHVREGVIVVNDSWEIAAANAPASTLLERTKAELVARDVRDVFPRSADSTFHSHFGDEDPPRKAVSFEDYYPNLDRWFEVRTVDVDDFLLFIRDVSGRRDLEGTIVAGQAELDRLNRINTIIQDIIRDLVGTTDREDIEERVCAGLAETELYEFTWIGESVPGSDRITPRTAAGDHEELVDLIVDGRQSPDVPEPPERSVMRTGETKITRQLADEGAAPDEIRRMAFAHGLQSAIAVPLRYGTTTYGVLGVYATRPDAFSDRERESLETLGVATGFVINAARQRNLLLSDTVVEITFRLDDHGDFFVAASGRYDCTIVVEGVVPLSEGALLCFATVEQVSPDNLLAMTEGRDDIDGGRVVHRTSPQQETEGGLVEVTISGRSPLLSVVELGGTVRTAEYEDGVGRIVAEIAPDADVRALVEAIGEAFPESELVAKRERQRAVETTQEFRSSLHERLTERQHTALRVAYHGGYFQSPRDSTAQNLAEDLGVSSPTLHTHLRAAQFKLIEAFLDERPGEERSRMTDDWQQNVVEGE